MRSLLEQELAQRRQAEAQLRGELDEQQTRLQALVQALSEGQSKLAAKTQELEAAQGTLAELQDKYAAVEGQLKSVGESLAQRRTQLAQEARRRAVAEGQASELAELRSSLEQELAQRRQAEAQLRGELDEQQTRLQVQERTLSEERSRLVANTQELETVTRELKAAGSQMAQQALEQRRIEALLLEGDQARTELTKQLEATRERDAARHKSIQSLESHLRQRWVECGRLTSELQAGAAERRRIQLQCESRQATLNELSNQLKEKAAAEQTWSRREAEFLSSVRKLQEQLADSAATTATQDAEIRRAKGKLEELLLIQSMLCGKVQALTVA
jgi:chromosome segregation ATPase